MLRRNLTDHAISNLVPDYSCDKCNVHNVEYVEKNEKICDSQDIYLLILVISHPNNTKARNAIRETWGMIERHHSRSVKTVFVLGRTGITKIDEKSVKEAAQFRDVLILDVIEQYFQLTLKTIGALKWASNICKSFQYLLKTDDDSFNNPVKYVEYLVHHGSPKKFLGGRCEWQLTNRDSEEKWGLSQSEYPHIALPLFCRGPGYVLSKQAAISVVKMSEMTRSFKLEDVFLMGFVRMRLGLVAMEIPGYYGKPADLDPCQLGHVTNIHHVTPTKMRELWDWTHNPARHCSNVPYALINSRFLCQAAFYSAGLGLIYLFIYIRRVKNQSK